MLRKTTCNGLSFLVNYCIIKDNVAVSYTHLLSAYDCEQVKITVEGQTLATGHAEYPGYMTKFE